MDIRILDSHLREFLKTQATPEDIGREVSLRAASVEKIEQIDGDTAYELEITTNRPDMMSVRGIAKETAASLTSAGIHATYHEPKYKPLETVTHTKHVKIVNDPKLIRRICAVEMELTQKETPDFIKKRLEEAKMRSLNIIIDITNYVMLETGHPTHAFDLDRLNTKILTVRESKKGEKITTLDKKTHELLGGDIIIEDENGRIVDLVGIMGLENSVITDNTKRILFFIDNNDPWKIRKTSMDMSIRTDAAALNEKDLDPELAVVALQTGITLYEKCADGRIIDQIIDIYPYPTNVSPVAVSFEKIDALVGVSVDIKKAIECLKLLGFTVAEAKTGIIVTPPTSRAKDIIMDADVIEEIARMIGYHTLPNDLPTFMHQVPYNQASNTFFWERRIKNALKYWGFTEVYTYSLVSKEMIGEGDYYKLANPLDEEHTYLRKSLVPSLLQVVKDNASDKSLQIFEMANIYSKRKNDLPHEAQRLGILMKGENITFSHIKGVVDQILTELGLSGEWNKPQISEDVTHVLLEVEGTCAGDIYIYPNNIFVAELLLDIVIDAYAGLNKTYVEPSKYPAVEEDITLITDEGVTTRNILNVIKKQSPLIVEVTMRDRYNQSRTFHITYQSMDRNLTADDITPIRETIIKTLRKDFSAEIK